MYVIRFSSNRRNVSAENQITRADIDTSYRNELDLNHLPIFDEHKFVEL